MQARHLARAAGVVLAVIAAVAALTLTAGTSTAAKPKKVFWIDLAGQASQAPDFVYFTANSGGQVYDLSWKKWGKKKTVGRGTFNSTAPCPPDCNEEGPAKLVLRKPVKCTPEFGEKEGKKVRVYRHAKLHYPDGEGGRAKADVTDRAGWATCKQSG